MRESESEVRRERLQPLFYLPSIPSFYIPSFYRRQSLHILGLDWGFDYGLN